MTKQLSTLAFYVKYHNAGWQSFLMNSKPQIKALEKKGFLEVDWNTKQARYTGK